MKNRPFHIRLGFALRGFAHAFRAESNFRIHVLAMCGVLVVLVIVRPVAVWWAIAALTVTAVLAAELFNTAVENLTDHLHPDQHPRIKAVKDCAAAAVLSTAIGALCIAAAFVYDNLL